MTETSIRIISIQKASVGEGLLLPIFLTCVQAGFPSPADDYIDKQLDLNELIVKHPAATFFLRVEGDSMRDAGIQSGDLIVVDRSIEPSHGKIIVAVVNGEFTVKRVEISSSGISLVPENPSFSKIKVTPESDFQVWGVVTYVVHKAS